MTALRLSRLTCMASPPLRRCPATDSHARIPTVKKIINGPLTSLPDAYHGVNAYHPTWQHNTETGGIRWMMARPLSCGTRTATWTLTISTDHSQLLLLKV